MYSSLSIELDQDFYNRKKKGILREFNAFERAAMKVIYPRFSIEEISLVSQRARGELNGLLNSLPFVGGDESPFTPLMINLAQTLAYYRAADELNLSVHEIGEIMYMITESYVNSISPIKRRVGRLLFFRKSMKEKWRKWLDGEGRNKYPGNWAGRFVEGDGESFEYGIDFTECACLKFLEKEGGLEIAPYICLTDYAKMRGIGVGFRRTKTLACGADKCDFRFKKGGSTQRGWPPEKLEEFSL